VSRIGVLDLQGGVAEHIAHLKLLGVAPIRVKKAEDFAALAGLIMPGGESTCISRLLRLFGLDEVIRQCFAEGMKVWGSCAGTILLAKQVVGETPHLALMDIEVQRNAFGCQLDSFNINADIPTVDAAPIPLTFIRAPKIVSVGAGVRTLLKVDDYIAAAEDEQCLATIFHPELTPSLAFHRYFCHKCGVDVAHSAAPTWRADAWTQIQ
jgi:5'-phosphate synthase pdxT subunit